MSNQQPLTDHSNSVLQAKNIHKTFNDGGNSVSVLKGIDLHVEQQEMVAIIGASGSGKSTLLHILGGLDTPDSGRVFIKQHMINQLSAKKQGEVRNQHLGFVYQFHHLLAEFNAMENVAMPLLIGGCDKSQANQRAEAMLAKVGLQHRLTHRPAQLSGGERQRVALARAMVTNPACVLADEPTGNLDTASAESVNQLMHELNQSEKTSFLIVSHDLKLAESMQRTYQMVDGQLELVKV